MRETINLLGILTLTEHRPRWWKNGQTHHWAWVPVVDGKLQLRAFVPLNVKSVHGENFVEFQTTCPEQCKIHKFTYPGEFQAFWLMDGECKLITLTPFVPAPKGSTVSLDLTNYLHHPVLKIS